MTKIYPLNLSLSGRENKNIRRRVQYHANKAQALIDDVTGESLMNDSEEEPLTKAEIRAILDDIAYDEMKGK